MDKFGFVRLVRFLLLSCIFFGGSTVAGEWQPLCIEGSSCESPYHVQLGGSRGGYRPIDRHAAGPLVTAEGILLHHSPLDLPILDEYNRPVRHIFQLSASGSDDLGGEYGYVSDANAIQVPGGRTYKFLIGDALAWLDPGEDIERIDWFGNSINDYLLLSAPIGPPVVVDSSIYIGILRQSGSSIYSSDNDGMSWTRSSANIRIGDDRFSLMQNPEKDALWAIESKSYFTSKGLWESVDHGAQWTQVDDGSFPFNTVRVVHDPEDSMVSYALTSHGLFVSVNRGVSWQKTTLTEPVHGMVFVERMLGLSRALIVGTDTGVWVSVDEDASWVSMGRGLPETAHTVTYGHGQLIATSDAGYFTCNAIDCAGLAAPVELEITEVDTVFYKSNGRIRISWESVFGATVYRVFRCLDESVESCGFPITFSRGTSFYDQDATPDIIYHYRVRACIRNNCGDFSAADTSYIKLATPVDIDASDGTFDEYVRISWKPVDGATVYRVLRCLDTEISSCALPIGFPRETFFSDTKATSGSIYHYRVRACITNNCSEFSVANTGFIN